MENQDASIVPFIIIGIVYVITLLFSIFFLLRASLTDPGIIPRKVDAILDSIPWAYRQMAE